MLDHVERLCAEVVVLHHGRIVAEGPVSQLRAMTQRNSSLEDVIAQRPLATVGLALGLGFLIGVTWRR